jgi:molybdate transport system substrate-binding protein
MRTRHAGWILGAIAILGSCDARRAPEPAKITVAAAANLTNVFGEIGRAFKAQSGVDVVFSYGATAQLSQQIENGAPFDVFASADTEHVDALVASHNIVAGSRSVYALGQLALWLPKGEESGARELKDLTSKRIRYIAVAQPELAPYGKATVETLEHLGLWESLQPKIVYGNTINAAREMAATGNADAAFTAYSLILHERGNVTKVDPLLYRPIEQALGVVASSTRLDQAMQFRAFLLGKEGQAILVAGGYLSPPQK